MSVDPRFPYGTRRKPDAPDWVYLLPHQVTDALGGYANFFQAAVSIVGMKGWATNDLCSRPPSDTDWNARLQAGAVEFMGQPAWNMAVFLDEFERSLVWPQYCEGVPAPSADLPPPVTYQAPAPAPPPPSLPPPPPLADVAGPDTAAQLAAQMTAISAMGSAVANLQALAEWLADNTALRQSTRGDPFDIAGTGHQVVSDAIGFEVVTSSYPPSLGRMDSDPPAILRLGYVSWGTTGALTKSEILTRPVQFVWTHGAQVQHFGWSLTPGVTASVTPLYPPPVVEVIPIAEPRPSFEVSFSGEQIHNRVFGNQFDYTEWALPRSGYGWINYCVAIIHMDKAPSNGAYPKLTTTNTSGFNTAPTHRKGPLLIEFANAYHAGANIIGFNPVDYYWPVGEFPGMRIPADDAYWLVVVPQSDGQWTMTLIEMAVPPPGSTT